MAVGDWTARAYQSVMSHSPQDLPPDLLAVARTLEEQGPRLTEPELSALKRRVPGPATSRGRIRRGGVTRSRAVIVALLATGGLMTSGGAALGISALSTDLTARSAQYGQPSPGQGQAQGQGQQGAGTLGSGTAGESVAQQGGAAEEGQAPEGGVSRSEAAAEAQPSRQLEASGSDELPFTGFAAIPMLLIGIALLATGLVGRSRSRAASGQR